MTARVLVDAVKYHNLVHYSFALTVISPLKLVQNKAAKSEHLVIVLVTETHFCCTFDTTLVFLYLRQVRLGVGLNRIELLIVAAFFQSAYAIYICREAKMEIKSEKPLIPI